MDGVSNVYRHAAKPDVIIFMAQVTILFIVVLTCLLNLTLYPDSDSKSVWISFLTGSLGYMMPNPRFKFEAIKVDDNTTTLDHNGVL